MISFFCSIVLIGIMAANIQTIDEDWYCVYRYIRKDHCNHLLRISPHTFNLTIRIDFVCTGTVQHALDGVMLFGGCFACIINGALSFISCYCYN